MTEAAVETPAEETDPIKAASRSDLIAMSLALEAIGAGMSDFGGQITAELQRRAVEEWKEQGTRATWQTPGVGQVILNIPESTLAVTPGEDADFASWVAENRPEEVVCTIRVETADLENVLHLLEEQGYDGEVITTDVTPRQSWLKSFLEKGVDEVEHWPSCTEECAPKVLAAEDGRCPDHQPEILYVDKKLGVPVPHITRLAPTRQPYISKRLDPKRKASATYTVSDFLRDRLIRGSIPAGVNPLALMAAPPVEVQPDPPVEVDGKAVIEGQVLEDVRICACGHSAKAEHRQGAKGNPGKCLNPDCGCRRFTERTPE